MDSIRDSFFFFFIILFRFFLLSFSPFSLSGARVVATLALKPILCDGKTEAKANTNVELVEQTICSNRVDAIASAKWLLGGHALTDPIWMPSCNPVIFVANSNFVHSICAIYVLHIGILWPVHYRHCKTKRSSSRATQFSTCALNFGMI